MVDGVKRPHSEPPMLTREQRTEQDERRCCSSWSALNIWTKPEDLISSLPPQDATVSEKLKDSPHYGHYLCPDDSDEFKVAREDSEQRETRDEQTEENKL